MLRQPARTQGPRGTQKSLTYTMQAPTGGWNTRDPLASMKETDAVVMENWISTNSQVEMRSGSVSQATGFTQRPQTLLPWNGPSGGKLFASTPSSIYEVTTPGAIGSASTTCTNQFWESVNFETPGGSFLICANGVDSVKEYDGTTWNIITSTSTPAITGVATTALNSVAVMVSRLWFVENSSMRAWYLPVLSIGGAAQSFDLGGVFPRGGHLVAMHNWTLDGGNGQDDYSVFISSEGEAAVYRGTDPASATTWSKVGTYYVGRPLGKRCLTKYGGDLLVLCENGLFPMSKALISADINRQQTLSAKIDPTFIQAARTYGANPGWRCVVFPQGSFILVNIPITSSYSEQYVMSTTTNAWCKFTGWSAFDFIVFGGKLYFAIERAISQGYVGSNDLGEPIQAKCQQAYSYYKYPAREKHMKLVRPALDAESQASVLVSLDVDFKGVGFPSTVTISEPAVATWGVSLWDGAVWAEDGTVRLDWETVASPPFFAAGLRLQCTSALTTISWSVTNFVYELGGVL